MNTNDYSQNDMEQNGQKEEYQPTEFTLMNQEAVGAGSEIDALHDELMEWAKNGMK